MNPSSSAPENVTPAIIVLGTSALPAARRILDTLPGATLHVLRKRFDLQDIGEIGARAIPIDNLGAHLRHCYTNGTPLIALCAAGIVIRCLAPVIGTSAKTDEPAVLAVAEDGGAVVPLLGGLSGANDLARSVAATFACTPAITTSGELRFGRCLLSPPPGYALADIDAGKRFVSDLLAGAPACIDGIAPWLDDLGLPHVTASEALSTHVTSPLLASRTEGVAQEDGAGHVRTIRIGIERSAPAGTLLIHPRGVVVNVCVVDDALADRIEVTLQQADIARAAVGALRCPRALMGDDRIDDTADAMGVPVRYTDASLDTGSDGIGLDIRTVPVTPDTLGIARGILSVIGLGPGDKAMLAPMASEALRHADDILGYTTYVDMAGPFAPWQRPQGTDNREEMARARHALQLAASGNRVAIVSSGDPGVFAMAAAVMEALDTAAEDSALRRVRVQIVPGITAAFATAAAAGAPLGHDCCLMSLSDNLKPWEIIETRLRMAAEADMAIALYNPISRARPWQLDRALALLRTIRAPETPVVLGRDIGRPGGRIRHHTLESLRADDVDMRTMVIIGASTTRYITNGSPGTRQWVYTPRWYPAAGQDATPRRER
ncbi:precorrin-3B C(17)-methyltransferase [Robbsia andropogonis]|uniref:precorrin-3B C(17)-methyltransferase n=1 Tax=Robbsia andropogonis TaxID=28092 RepID=UPI003D199FAB